MDADWIILLQVKQAKGIFLKYTKPYNFFICRLFFNKIKGSLCHNGNANDRHDLLGPKSPNEGDRTIESAAAAAW